MVKLIDQWMNYIDGGDRDHSHLICTLSNYKLSNLSLNWFTSYHDARLQAISSNHRLSEFSQILSVPQGSVLRPTSLLFFINYLPLSIQHGSADFFAVDSILHASGDNKDVESKFQSCGTNGASVIIAYYNKKYS